MEPLPLKSWKESHKIEKTVWSTRQSLTNDGWLWLSRETVISMHVQKDSFVLKFIKKLNGFNRSFIKKTRLRKENKATHENVT